MKEKAQKKLLKAISEVAAGMVEGRTCWHGREAVESAIMEYLADYVKRRDYRGLLEDDLGDYLPHDKPY